MFEYNKGVIRSYKLKKDRQYNGQKFEYNKGVIRSYTFKEGQTR